MISKDADKTICIIYKEYLTRRKSSLPKQQASRFEIEELQALMKNEIREDIFEYLRELKLNNFIDHYDLNGGFHLSSNGIVYMEQRFGKKVDKIIDHLSKFIP